MRMFTPIVNILPAFVHRTTSHTLHLNFSLSSIIYRSYTRGLPKWPKMAVTDIVHVYGPFWHSYIDLVTILVGNAKHFGPKWPNPKEKPNAPFWLSQHIHTRALSHSYFGPFSISYPGYQERSNIFWLTLILRCFFSFLNRSTEELVLEGFFYTRIVKRNKFFLSIIGSNRKIFDFY